MATVAWRGGAVAVAQVAAGSIDSLDATPANNTFHVTIGNVTLSQVGDTDVATTAAALVATLNGSTHPYFAAITWANPSGGTIRGTADTAGVPFVASLTETGAGTGAVTDFSDTTANQGPNAFGTAENWSSGSVPANNDTIVFSVGDVPCAYELATGLTGITLYVDDTYTGTIGLPRASFATSVDGATGDDTVTEYREDYLTLEASLVELGRRVTVSEGTGSGRIKIDNTRAAASTTIVHSTGQALDAQAVLLRTAHASANIEVRVADGGVGIASEEPGDTSTAGTISISGNNGATQLSIADGVGYTTLNVASGQVMARASGNVTTVKNDGAELTLEGSGWDVVTLNQNAGNTYLNGQVDITTANLEGGTLDGSQSDQARTIGTLNANGGELETDDALTISAVTFGSRASVSIVPRA